jgi:branched-chain amino acid transport system permease protein
VSFEWLMEPLYYASIISLLSVGITLSYMTTRVFNFAHVRFAMVAAYISASIMFYIIE